MNYVDRTGRQPTTTVDDAWDFGKLGGFAAGLAELISAAGAASLIPSAGVIGICAVAAVTLDSDVDESPKERCKRIKNYCIQERCYDELPTHDYAGDPFHKCVRECMDEHECP